MSSETHLVVVFVFLQVVLLCKMCPLSSRECHLLLDHYWSPISLGCSEEPDGWDLQPLTQLSASDKTPESWQDIGLIIKWLYTREIPNQAISSKSKCMRLKLTCCTLLQSEGGAGVAALQHTNTSQLSAEFDTQTKSSPLLLKGFHWRVKQHTESQCDCLSNEKITALHLTENDLRQKYWVNKTLTNGPLTCWSP